MCSVTEGFALRRLIRAVNPYSLRMATTLCHIKTASKTITNPSASLHDCVKC